jgi:hypothetical protein
MLMLYFWCFLGSLWLKMSLMRFPLYTYVLTGKKLVEQELCSQIQSWAYGFTTKYFSHSSKKIECIISEYISHEVDPSHRKSVGLEMQVRSRQYPSHQLPISSYYWAVHSCTAQAAWTRDLWHIGVQLTLLRTIEPQRIIECFPPVSIRTKICFHQLSSSSFSIGPLTQQIIYKGIKCLYFGRPTRKK